jgi:CRP-like cAMP-binding protein
MFLEKRYRVGAIAPTDSLVVRVSKEAVFAEINRNPLFARQMIASLAQRVEALVGELESHALGSAVQRLIAYLLRQTLAGASGAVDISLPIAKRALASRLNLSAEHLSRILHGLSTRGLVLVHGRRLRIPDHARLRAFTRARYGPRPTNSQDARIADL